MDSVSQLVLGAAIGEATLGKKLGRASLVLGAALGTLPDLDVLVQYTDAVESFTYHRSWSHSVFTLSLLSFFIAGLCYKYWPLKWLPQTADGDTSKENSRPKFREWLLGTWLVLVTHPILDGFTVYGTQLLWPLPTVPVAWGSLFIIDPLYTLPLIIGIWMAWKHRQLANAAVKIALLVSTTYIVASLVSQNHARKVALYSLKKQGLGTENVLIAPAPFSVFWRIVSMEDNEFHEGFYSLLDKDHDLTFDSYPTHRNIIEANYERWPIKQLDWFTQGMISASVEDERVIINDLRMGVESSYVFRFDVGPIGTQVDTGSLVSELLPINMNQERMKALVQRVWDENQLVPLSQP